jgi:hypothetical protein
MPSNVPKLAMDRAPFAEFLAQISPRLAVADDPGIAIQDASIIN